MVAQVAEGQEGLAVSHKGAGHAVGSHCLFWRHTGGKVAWWPLGRLCVGGILEAHLSLLPSHSSLRPHTELFKAGDWSDPSPGPQGPAQDPARWTANEWGPTARRFKASPSLSISPHRVNLNQMQEGRKFAL